MANRCSHCGAPVVWASTRAGKLLRIETWPLPPDVPGGWVIEGMTARPVSPTTDDPNIPRYAEHASRCPPRHHVARRVP
jgi:hypothetical protein